MGTEKQQQQKQRHKKHKHTHTHKGRGVGRAATLALDAYMHLIYIHQAPAVGSCLKRKQMRRSSRAAQSSARAALARPIAGCAMARRHLRRRVRQALATNAYAKRHPQMQWESSHPSRSCMEQQEVAARP